MGHATGTFRKKRNSCPIEAIFLSSISFTLLLPICQTSLLLLCSFCLASANKPIIFLKILFIYLRERAQARGATEGEGEAALFPSLKQGSQCGAPSQDPRIMTWAKGRCLMNWATQVPPKDFKVISTPNVGLEPMFLRSRTTCSTKWTSQVPQNPFNFWFEHIDTFPFLINRMLWLLVFLNGNMGLDIFIYFYSLHSYLYSLQKKGNYRKAFLLLCLYNKTGK